MVEYLDQFMVAGTQPTDDDKRLMVTFSLEPRINHEKTETEGRLVYRDIEYVTIRIPGDKTLSVHRPVNASDRHRFPLQYQAFKNRNNELVVGTPLSTWPGIQPSQAKELDYFNVRTVEQLAAMGDSGAGQMMGIQKLKAAAKQFLEASKDAAGTLKLQKELESRDNKIAALEDTLSKLVANLEKMQSKAK